MRAGAIDGWRSVVPAQSHPEPSLATVAAAPFSLIGGKPSFAAGVDHLYSPAALANSVGVVIERYAYDSYGHQTVKSALGATSAKSTVVFDRSFTGYQLDEESGLNSARARMYSSTQGRFVSRDDYMQWTREIENGDYASKYIDIVYIPYYRIYAYEEKEEQHHWRPMAMDGYQDGMNFYRGYLVPNCTDPSGRNPLILALLVLGYPISQLANVIGCYEGCKDVCPSSAAGDCFRNCMGQRAGAIW